MLLGCHVSYGAEGIYGSAKQAVEYGANAFMFYTGAPQNTFRKEIKEEDVKAFHEYIKQEHIAISSVICHAPYIINLANQSDMDKWQFSVNFLIQEVKRCEQMGVQKMVLHPRASTCNEPSFFRKGGKAFGSWICLAVTTSIPSSHVPNNVLIEFGGVMLKAM